MTTPLRRLDGVAYWVIEGPDEIFGFINSQIRKEWTADAKDEGGNPQEDPWLQELPKRKWRLQIL